MFATGFRLLGLICCCLLISASAGLLAALPFNQPVCPDGWEEFRESFGNGRMCYLLVAEPKTWTEAAEHCRAQISTLMHMERVNVFQRFEGESDVPIYLGNYIFELQKPSFWEYWTGMSVKDDRLMWEADGPRYVQKPKNEARAWDWSPQQPSLDNGTCGYVTLTYNNQTFFNEPKGVTETIQVFSNRYNVSLGNCEDKRSFVCHMTPILPVVKHTTSCPGEWVGNVGIQHCYRLYTEALPYTEAETKCQIDGGQIVPSGLQFDLNFIFYVYNFYADIEKYFEATHQGGIWVQTTENMKLESVCKSFDTRMVGEVTDYTTHIQCNQSLPFICIKPIVPVELKGISVRSIYSNPDDLLSFPAFESFPVSGISGRAPDESEILFLETPFGILNSTLGWQNVQQIPSFNGIQLDLLTSQPTDRPYYVNMSVPSSQFSGRPARSPARRSAGKDPREVIYQRDLQTHRDRRQSPGLGDVPPELEIGGLVDGLPSNVNYDTAVQFIGYYSFGVYSRSPPRYHQTKQHLVRYSEPDMFIYIASVRMRDSVLSSTGEVTQEDITAFNLLKDESYVFMLTREYTSGILFRNPINLLQFYKGTPERISNFTLYIRVFASSIAGRTFGPELERTVMDLLETSWREQLSGNDIFIPSSVSFRSTVSCPRRMYTDKKNNFDANFPATHIGSTGYTWERCVGGKGAYASAICKGNYYVGAHWGPVIIAEGCNTTRDYKQSSSTADLKILSEVDMNTSNIITVLNDTFDLTSPYINLTAIDVLYAADILTNFLDYAVVTPDTLEHGMSILNNILQTGDGVIAEAQKLGSAGNRIIRAVDELTNNLWTGTSDLRIVRDYVAAEVIRQTDDGTSNLTIGIELEGSMVRILNDSALHSVEQPMDVDVDATDVAIYLPLDVIKGGESQLTFHIYAKPDLFATEGDRYAVNSKVAAARLTKGDQPVLDLGDDRVTAIFLQLKEDEFITCGYWDYAANENAGGWRTDGCTHNVSGHRVICKCDHLTNFAILIDMDAHKISDTDKLVLSIITKVGLTLSIIGLGLTVLTFIIFRHLRKGRGQQVLINLSTAMLCSSIVFLAGSERTESYGGCIAVAVLLHYFILVAFMWMLVEGVLQYLRFVKVLGTYIPKFMMKTMIPAWGIPLIPVIIVLVLDYDLYYGGKGYCWLQSDAMLYAFIIPVAVVIFANIIVFLMVMCNLCRRRNKGLKVNQSERKMAFLHFQAAVSIFVVLGLTWVFGFFAIEDARTVFHYLFAIFNAFQGLFIFLLFTAREKQIRKAWKKLCCKKSQDKSFTSGTDSHGVRRAKAANTGTSNSSGNTATDIRSTGGYTNTTSKGGSRFDDIQYDNIGGGDSTNGGNMKFSNPEYKP